MHKSQDIYNMRLLEFLPNIINNDKQLDELFFLSMEPFLTENVDQNNVTFLKKTFKKEIKDVNVGTTCVPLLVVCYGDQVVITGRKSLATIIKINDGVVEFDYGQQFPRQRETAVTFSKLFLFETEYDVSQFLTYLSLKLDNIQISINESIV